MVKMEVFSNGFISLDILELGSKIINDFLVLEMLGITYKEESWKEWEWLIKMEPCWICTTW